MLKRIQFLDAVDIPEHLEDSCLELDCEFPLHCAGGIVWIEKENVETNDFAKWLVEEKGFDFEGQDYNNLCVQGT